MPDSRRDKSLSALHRGLILLLTVRIDHVPYPVNRESSSKGGRGKPESSPALEESAVGQGAIFRPQPQDARQRTDPARQRVCPYTAYVRDECRDSASALSEGP